MIESQTKPVRKVLCVQAQPKLLKQTNRGKVKWSEAFWKQHNVENLNVASAGFGNITVNRMENRGKMIWTESSPDSSGPILSKHTAQTSAYLQTKPAQSSPPELRLPQSGPIWFGPKLNQRCLVRFSLVHNSMSHSHLQQS